jgi:glycerol kinase
MQAGTYPSQEAFSKTWALQRRFEPAMDAEARSAKYTRWKTAIQATLSV